MKINITLHAVERYMEKHNIVDIWEANNLLRSRFMHIYQFWEIWTVYNVKSEVTLGSEKIVFSERDWVFNLITYIVLDKGTRASYKKIKKYKTKMKKERKNKLFNR